MNEPTYTLPANRAGFTVTNNGRYTDKSVSFPDPNGDGMAHMKVRCYNQAKWLWTGYRWVLFGNEQANNTVIYRDRVHGMKGRKVRNNAWV
jgi:hypothetical protein